MAVEDFVSVEPAGEFALKGLRRLMEVHNVKELRGTVRDHRSE